MKDIFSNIGYSFKDSSLVEIALTHKSFSSSNNERLEFLGDALINLYISEYRYFFSLCLMDMTFPIMTFTFLYYPNVI